MSLLPLKYPNKDRDSKVGFCWDFGYTIGSPHSPYPYWDEWGCHFSN
jgi:hypothetical protein